MKKACLLFFCMALLLYGCDVIQKDPASTAPSSAASLPEISSTKNDQESSSDISDDGDEFYKKGEALLETEKIGGLCVFMTEKDVIKLFGEPTTKKKPKMAEIDLALHWNVAYSEIGLEINYIQEEGEEGKIYFFSIDSKKFEGETLRGIRIGSKKQDVLDAYADEINVEDSDKDLIVAGSMYWGIIFKLSGQDEVVSIFFGAGAE